MASLSSLLIVAVINVKISFGEQQVLYSNPGPLDPQSEDLLTSITMTDDMFIQMDISIDSFPTTNWKYVFFIGDPRARVPDIWLWNPAQSADGLAVHFSRDGGGQLTYPLQGSGKTLQLNTVYRLQICYDQTTLTTRISGGDIDGMYMKTAGKKIHDNVLEPVHVGYPNNDNGDADAIITNLYIGSGADCNQPLDLECDAEELCDEMAAVNGRIDQIIAQLNGVNAAHAFNGGAIGDSHSLISFNFTHTELLLLCINILTIVFGLVICWRGGLFSKNNEKRYSKVIQFAEPEDVDQAIDA